jgi:DNA-binding MarR family transcriptional regulator
VSDPAQPTTTQWGATAATARAKYSDVSRALRAVQRAGAEANRELARRLGIGLTDLHAMNHIFSGGDRIGPVELGQRLGIRSASATALVDRLEESGHVRREPHPDDRRRVVLVPSEQSAVQTMAAMTPMLVDIEAAAARLTDSERAAATRFLTEAAEAMRRYARGGGDS